VLVEVVVVTVMMLVPVPPEVSVTLGVPTEKAGGVNTKGEIDADKVTAPANEFKLAREIVEWAEVPWGTVNPAGPGIAVKLAGVPTKPSWLLIATAVGLPLLTMAREKWITSAPGLLPPV
jgi:hypothetical protein